MPSAARLAAPFALLLLVLTPITGVLAGSGPCAGECEVDCGTCSACEPAGLPSRPPEWNRCAGARCTPPPGARPAETTAARSIEHVPLQNG